jgi:GTP-binding protein
MEADTLDSNLIALFETIVREVPPPKVVEDAPAALLVTTLEYDNYKGQIGIGRLQSGSLRRGQNVLRIRADGTRTSGRIEYLFTFFNLHKVEVDEVRAGDILAFGGLEDLGISDTITDPANPVMLPPILVEEPTVRMTFGVNTSPLAGREGKTGWGTSRRLRERLYNETRSNLALRVEDGDSPDRFIVSGRGELHLGILIETMRREGYEFDVSKPEVILRRDEEANELLEPIEEVHIEVADNMVGTVVELLGARRGRMIDMRTDASTTYMRYLVPTRGLLGFRSQFMTATSGMGQIHSIFYGYDVFAGAVPGRQFGSLVAWEAGVATGYAMVHAQSRGTFFIEPGTEVYEGMVVGEHIRPEDLAVNLCKTKNLSAVRTKNYADEERLKSARTLSLDDYLEFIAEDELLEVTPLSLRARKRVLNNERRMKDQKAREKLMAGE